MTFFNFWEDSCPFHIKISLKTLTIFQFIQFGDLISIFFIYLVESYLELLVILSED